MRVRVPSGDPIVERELSPPDEAELAVRRLVAVLRIARVVEDRLGTDPDTAARIATALMHPTPHDDS